MAAHDDRGARRRALALLTLTLALAACVDDTGQSAYSFFTQKQFEQMNSRAVDKIFLPKEVPSGAASGPEYAAFFLSDIETGRLGRSTYWVATFDSSLLGGTFKVVQLPRGATNRPCSDFSEKGSVPITSITTARVRVCVPVGERFSSAAAAYWSSVDWTNDVAGPAWLRPDD